MSHLRELLKDKLPNSTEIEIHLFEFCNLSCSFCGQDHDSKVGMDEYSFVSKADRVIEFMETNENKSHIINLMGGEIFNDEVPDEIFTYYSKFHQLLSEWANKEEGVTLRFNWVTNLIFNKSKRVEEFIKSHPNSYISTSYDFSGRGLDINRKLAFDKNLELFSDYITVIGFVLTRPAIRKLLANTDNYFKKLYAKYTLYFDYYVPELSASKLMPSEQEMLDAYRYIAAHYPNVYPIKDWVENDKNLLTCYSINKLTLLPDNREVKCRYMEYEESDFLTPIDYTSNENIIEAHLERNNCFSCEHYDRCQFRCFVQVDWSALERLAICPMKTFFDEHPLV